MRSCISLPLHSSKRIEPIFTVCLIRIHYLTLFVVYNYMDSFLYKPPLLYLLLVVWFPRRIPSYTNHPCCTWCWRFGSPDGFLPIQTTLAVLVAGGLVPQTDSFLYKPPLLYLLLVVWFPRRIPSYTNHPCCTCCWWFGSPDGFLPIQTTLAVLVAGGLLPQTDSFLYKPPLLYLLLVVWFPRRIPSYTNHPCCTWCWRFGSPDGFLPIQTTLAVLVAGGLVPQTDSFLYKPPLLYLVLVVWFPRRIPSYTNHPCCTWCWWFGSPDGFLPIQTTLAVLVAGGLVPQTDSFLYKPPLLYLLLVVWFPRRIPSYTNHPCCTCCWWFGSPDGFLPIQTTLAVLGAGGLVPQTDSFLYKPPLLYLVLVVWFPRRIPSYTNHPCCTCCWWVGSPDGFLPIQTTLAVLVAGGLVPQTDSFLYKPPLLYLVLAVCFPRRIPSYTNHPCCTWCWWFGSPDGFLPIQTTLAVLVAGGLVPQTDSFLYKPPLLYLLLVVWFPRRIPSYTNHPCCTWCWWFGSPDGFLPIQTTLAVLVAGGLVPQTDSFLYKPPLLYLLLVVWFPRRIPSYTNHPCCTCCWWFGSPDGFLPIQTTLAVLVAGGLVPQTDSFLYKPPLLYLVLVVWFPRRIPSYTNHPCCTCCWWFGSPDGFLPIQTTLAVLGAGGLVPQTDSFLYKPPLLYLLLVVCFPRRIPSYTNHPCCTCCWRFGSPDGFLPIQTTLAVLGAGGLVPQTDSFLYKPPLLYLVLAVWFPRRIPSYTNHPCCTCCWWFASPDGFLPIQTTLAVLVAGGLVPQTDSFLYKPPLLYLVLVVWFPRRIPSYTNHPCCTWCWRFGSPDGFLTIQTTLAVLVAGGLVPQTDSFLYKPPLMYLVLAVWFPRRIPSYTNHPCCTCCWWFGSPDGFLTIQTTLAVLVAGGLVPQTDSFLYKPPLMYLVLAVWFPRRIPSYTNHPCCTCCWWFGSPDGFLPIQTTLAVLGAGGLVPQTDSFLYKPPLLYLLLVVWFPRRIPSYTNHPCCTWCWWFGSPDGFLPIQTTLAVLGAGGLVPQTDSFLYKPPLLYLLLVVWFPRRIPSYTNHPCCTWCWWFASPDGFLPIQTTLAVLVAGGLLPQTDSFLYKPPLLYLVLVVCFPRRIPSCTNHPCCTWCWWFGSPDGFLPIQTTLAVLGAGGLLPQTDSFLYKPPLLYLVLVVCFPRRIPYYTNHP